MALLNHGFWVERRKQIIALVSAGVSNQEISRIVGAGDRSDKAVEIGIRNVVPQEIRALRLAKKNAWIWSENRLQKLGVALRLGCDHGEIRQRLKIPSDWPPDRLASEIDHQARPEDMALFYQAMMRRIERFS